MSGSTTTLEELERENATLRAQLEEAQEALRAIREGEVDALVVQTPQGERVFTLHGADAGYRAIIEQMSEGAVTLHQDGTIQYANRGFAAMLDVPLEKVVGTPFWQYVAETDRPAFQAMLCKCLSDSAGGELSLCAVGLKKIPVHLGLSLISTNEDQSICVVVTDLSEQKRAEWLLASERFARAILDQAADGITVFDSEGRLTFANAAARRLAGLDPAGTDLDFGLEAWGQRFFADGTPIPPEDQFLQRALRGEHTLARESHLIRLDGSQYDVLSSASPLIDGNGQIIGVVGIFHDITEWNQAEEKIRVQSSALEGAANAIVILDFNGTIQWVNPAFTRLTGYTAAEAIGQNPRVLKSGRHPPEFYADLWKTVKAGRVWHQEIINKRKDGTLYTEEMTITPVANAQGAWTHFIAIKQDVTERKAVEAALRESEEKYRTLFESIDQGFCTIEVLFDENDVPVDYRFLIVNPAFERQTGIAHAAGRRMREIAPQHEEHWFQLYGKIALTGEPLRFENPAVELNRYFEVYAWKIGLPEERKVAILFNDISARKRADDELKRTAALLEAIGNSTPDSIFVKDRAGRMLYINPGALKAINRTADQILGRTDIEWHPNYAEAAIFMANDRKVMESGQSQVTEEALTDARGLHIFLNTKSPLRNAAGEVIGLVGVAREITENKKVEEASRRHYATLEGINLLLSAALTCPTESDLGARCLEIAQEITQSKLGFIGEIINDRLHDIAISDSGWNVCNVVDADGQRRTPGSFKIHGIFDRVLIDGKALFTNDPAHHPDSIGLSAGHPPLESFLGVPLVREGRTIGMVAGANRPGGYTPIEQETLEALAPAIVEAFMHRRAEDALKEEDRRKNEFLATLSHELRNPLAPIVNALDLLKLAQGNARAIEPVLPLLERQVHHLVRLVDDLLDMDRIRRGRVELRRERVELAVVVQRAVEASQPVIDVHAHELIVSLPPKPIILDADPIRLAQIISNLLNNAAKYTEQAGRIWLTVEQQGSDAVVSVRDTGIGIAAENLSTIFEMFSQVAPALERSQGGLGIGLALVRGLVELHGGTIEARSGGIGKGSEFIVRLPVVLVPVPKKTQEPTADGQASISPRRRILVVDDNKETANSWAEILKLMGHEARTAYDGLEALQTAETFQPDMVLMDVGMPRMNGYESAQQIRKQAWGKNMVLCALTGWGQEEDRQRSQDAGFDHHLVKPIKVSKVMELLNDLRVNAAKPQPH